MEKRKLTGKQEAYLVALTCSDPPEGKKRWSMQLLADRLVELEMVEEISDETGSDVRSNSKRGHFKPWVEKQWCIPEVGAEFVWRMEDVLELYEEPYDPKKPVVCFDELPYQMVAEKRTPWPAKPGRPQRYD